MKKLIKSFKYAFEGIFTGIKEEQNMKIHIAIMIIVIIFGITLKISKIEWIICIALFGLVISMELINTAIENTVDCSRSGFSFSNSISFYWINYICT